MKKMPVYSLFFLYLIAFSILTFPQETEAAKTTLAVDWGSNYYGNTAAVGINRVIHEHFSVGLNVSFGRFKCTLPHHGTKFKITNYLEQSLVNNIKIHYIANASIYWHRKRDKVFTLLNTFGIGLGRYYITLKQKTTKEGVPGEYEGSKDLSRNALFFTVHLFEFRQKRIPHFGITMGVKSHLSSIKIPQPVVLLNFYRHLIVSQDGKGHYPVPYIEGFLRVSCSF